MKKVLFIASLNTSKERFDGERIKSTLMYSSIKKLTDVEVINLSKHKLLGTFRILFHGLFSKKRFDKIIISKDPHGANIIVKVLKFAKFPMDKILYFEIGPFLYDRILNGSIKKETFLDVPIIVETNSMKKELKSIGVNVYDVFPNFKLIYDIELPKKSYPKDVLNLVFFSRLDEMKGVYDLLECVLDLNKNGPKFNLDIYGKYSINFEEKSFNDLISKSDLISYKGKLDINGAEEYRLLSQYDLHVFPTKYSEGFPGSLIDFFIAGVPTLSSIFDRAYDILTDDDSFFFDKGNKEDLKKQLLYIYDNQITLSQKSLKTHNRRNEFSDKTFEEYLSKLLEVDNTNN